MNLTELISAIEGREIRIEYNTTTKIVNRNHIVSIVSTPDAITINLIDGREMNFSTSGARIAARDALAAVGYHI